MNRKMLSVFAVGAVAALGSSGLAQNSTPATQQDRSAQNAAAVRAAQDAAPATQERVETARSTETKPGIYVRASKMIGTNIQNPEGKNVGQINDFVIDADTGRIRYAAVTYGGFLGIGNKMFAVPFEAFQFRAVRNDSNERILILDVTQTQLEGSVGFDENNWPNFADQSLTKDLDRRYRVQRNRTGDVDINVNRNGIDINVDRNPPVKDPGTTTNPNRKPPQP